MLPAGDLAVQQVLLHLGHPDLAECALPRRPEVDRDVRHPGDEDERVGTELVRQLLRGVVLVDHGVDPGVPVPGVDDGDTASSCGDDDDAVAGEGADRPRWRSACTVAAIVRALWACSA